MNLKEVMTPDVEVVGPHATLQEAAQKMRDLDVGSLPVCDGARVLGMITDRDITIRAVAAGHDPRQSHVHATMSPELIYCFEDRDIKEAADLMARHQIRRLPILNRDKKLVGIVSLGDLATDLNDEELVGAVLEDVSEPARPQR
ncbi:MAG: CBS domain-containing protein [Anaerolineales bacterium]